MGIEKLSANVNKKVSLVVKRIIWAICLLAGLIVLAIFITNTIRDNNKQVRLYTAEIDNKMQEKVGFINTVASGAAADSITDYYAYVDRLVKQYDDVSAVYVCVKDRDAIYKDGIMTYMSGGWLPPEDFVASERGWFVGANTTGDVYVSDPYIDEQSGNMCITLSKTIFKDGIAIGVAGLDMYMDDLVSVVETSYDGGNYVFLASDNGTILTHPNADIALKADSSSNVEDALNGKYNSVCQENLRTKLIMDYSGGFKFAISNRSESTGWNVVAIISVSWIIVLIIVIVVAAIVLGIVFAKYAQSIILRSINPMFAPLENLSQNISRISDGELSYAFEVDQHSQEVNALSIAMNNTIHSLQGYISEITKAVNSISQKKLDFEVDAEFVGDYEEIKSSLIGIMDVLNESFYDINEKAEEVLSFSGQLSEMSENVAKTATDQSSAVMDASNMMGILTKNMEEIAKYAAEIKDNTENANASLRLSNKEMQELVAAMDDISECYNEIAEFVTEINGIADQTSLLALNASIEAARAGEAGRGFAVVAQEIGSLSASSTQSSQKINDVIGKSLSAVEKGKKLVAQTEKTIEESVDMSVENSKLVGDIVGFVDSQKQSADDISENLTKISDMAGNNAASAEENSAISISLGECAQSLIDTIGQFSLR